MKLITRTSLNFISICTVFFLIGSIIMYFSVRNIIKNDFKQQLLNQKEDFIASVNQNDISQLETDFLLINSSDINEGLSFSDTVLIIKNKYLLFKKLDFTHYIKGKNYKISILKSQSQSDLLIMKLVIMNIGFAMFFFLIVFYVNRHSIRSALKVFYSTINKLEGFNINQRIPLKLDNAEVYEIKKLNTVFEKMSKQIKNDFELQKEYTENVTHELQTPLSIISTKVDELMQSENLNKIQMEKLALLMETTNRLSRMNKSLIFLTKIDNRFYSENKELLLNSLIHSSLDTLSEFIDQKKINVTLELNDDVFLEMDLFLAQTTLFNLIKNAIIHNNNGGFLKIFLTKKELIISNSGSVLNFDNSNIFKRFSRVNTNSKSLGIGLSIVKKICDLYDIDIKYIYDKEHIFILNFKKFC